MCIVNYEFVVNSVVINLPLSLSVSLSVSLSLSHSFSPSPSFLIQRCVEVLCACPEVDISLSDFKGKTAFDVASPDCQLVIEHKSKSPIQLLNAWYSLF